MYIVTAKEMQQMDRATIEIMGIPGRLLMENAGRGATAFFLETTYRNHPGAVGIIAGRGNNGGDGFVMARYLHQMGISATVFLMADPNRIEGDASTNLKLLNAMGVPVIEVADDNAFSAAKQTMVHQHTWIDAILGTGLKSDVRGHFQAAIRFINEQERPVFAVDIASGLNADTGQVCGTCIKAYATATFGFAKIGHLTYPGRTLTGKLKVVEIGIPPTVAKEIGCRQHLISPRSLKTEMPKRSATAHKGDTGHLLILAGSQGKTGAAAMASTSAMRAGAGLVTLGIPDSLNPILETIVTETMTIGLPETAETGISETACDSILSLATDKQCLAVGPGLGTDPSTGRLLEHLIEKCPVPMVIDADALNLIAKNPAMLNKAQSPLVLTPHPGEMFRLSGHTTATIQSNRIQHARSFAQNHGVHLVLKGAATVIADPDGTVFINSTGNPGMAAGGMGDVLTGLIAGFITQGMEVGAAARAGVFLHGLAADRMALQNGPVGYLATEVINTIPYVINELLSDHDAPFGPQLDPLFHSPDEDL